MAAALARVLLYEKQSPNGTNAATTNHLENHMKSTNTVTTSPFFAALNGVKVQTRIKAGEGARGQEQNDKTAPPER